MYFLLLCLLTLFFVLLLQAIVHVFTLMPRAGVDIENQSIKQSIDRSINQSSNQSINQSINQKRRDNCAVSCSRVAGEYGDDTVLP